MVSQDHIEVNWLELLTALPVTRMRIFVGTALGRGVVHAHSPAELGLALAAWVLVLLLAALDSCAGAAP